MLKAGSERVRLDPGPLAVPRARGVRVTAADGSVELEEAGPWLLVCVLFFMVVALLLILAVGLRASLIGIVASVVVPTMLFLALLTYGDGGANLVRIWRFTPGRVSRELRLPLPGGIWPRVFDHVSEFEIGHRIWTTGLLGRRQLEGGHDDTLRFRMATASHTVTIVTRLMPVSGATLRGNFFTQEQADRIQDDIHPDVLAIASLTARAVGVPLHVVERTRWIGNDFAG
jgi:hypothetical protein